MNLSFAWDLAVLRGERHQFRFIAATLAVAAFLVVPSLAKATVTSSVVGGQLIVENNAGGITFVGCSSAGGLGTVRVNGADPGTGPAACSAITKIEVRDRSNGQIDDTFNLSGPLGVNATNFPGLPTTIL